MFDPSTFQLSLPFLLAIPLLPLIASILIGIFGTQFGGNLLNRRVSHSLAIMGVLASFVLSSIVLLNVMDGERFHASVYRWMSIGNLHFEIGFLIDGLTATMLCVVTFVSLMVHIYTIGYMQDDEGYNRFFSYISLFTFAMLMLVMSDNLLQLFFGWEAVGLVSYLLIGFWYKKQTAIFANMKAFLVNRVGDFGFILGIALLFAATGHLDYQTIFSQTEHLAKAVVPGTNWSLITVACIALFVGAMGKSAQFPLHVWLPDSMEGPTPISALIHAATMVTAGIFMVARMSPLFELSDVALSFVMVIGAITALFMGFLGIIQNDIKRIVAYSTLSQLGYMTVALGASAYSVAIFHLMTHAFFKALLFLGAGAVIIAMHHEQDIRHMGGLKKYMPMTWLVMLIGTLALVGMPFFSGFYSKENIIEAVKHSHLLGSSFAYFALLAGVFVTAFYSFRLLFLVFHGKERFAGDTHSDHAAHPDEAQWVILLPLILLAIPSVLIGYIAAEPFLSASFLADAIHVDALKHGAMHMLAEEFKGSFEMGLHGLMSLPFALVLAAIALSYLCYVRYPQIPQRLQKYFKWIYTLLENKYYLDAFNQQVIARITRGLGQLLSTVGDRFVIDGFFVNGSANCVGKLGSLMRRLQTGILSQYAFVMLLGLAFALFLFLPIMNWN